jgi:DNA polymerase III sliding clamp (beta) subunit (PCNA family)
MEISAKKLKATLDLVKPAVPSPKADARWSDAVLVAEGSLNANNGRVAVSVGLIEAREEDYFLLPYSRILKLVSNLQPYQLVTLEKLEDRGGVRVRTPEGLSSALLTKAPHDYPPFPVVAAVAGGTVDGDRFIARLLEMVPFAKKVTRANEGDRPELQGVSLNMADELALAATDGFRLAHQRCDIGFPVDPPVPTFISVPLARLLAHVWKRSLPPSSHVTNYEGNLGQVLASLGGTALAQRDLSLTWSEKGIQFSFGETFVANYIPVNRFPDYQNILMGEGSHQIVVDAFQLLQSLRQVQPLTKDKDGAVRLVWSPHSASLEVSGGDDETGMVRATIKAAIKSDEGGRIAFRIRYLLEFLAKKEGRVLIECNRQGDPARLTALRGPIYQVMPVAVNWEQTPGEPPALAGEVVDLDDPAGEEHEEEEPDASPEPEPEAPQPRRGRRRSA